MSTPQPQSFVERYLDPTDRLDEMLFALIMVLSITLGVGLATDAGGSASKVVWAILGCNLAWGLIDGCMYVVTQMFDRSSKARIAQALRSSHSEDEQVATVGSELDDALTPLTSADERRALYLTIASRLRGVDMPRTRVKAEDVYGGLAILWLMVLASIPAIVPFLFIGDRFVAARVSNGLVLATLFAVGFGYARLINASPWIMGWSTVVFGLAMVVIAMLLGG
jgi:VIT family